jgi:hypothetical protein
MGRHGAVRYRTTDCRSPRCSFSMERRVLVGLRLTHALRYCPINIWRRLPTSRNSYCLPLKTPVTVALWQYALNTTVIRLVSMISLCMVGVNTFRIRFSSSNRRPCEQDSATDSKLLVDYSTSLNSQISGLRPIVHLCSMTR